MHSEDFVLNDELFSLIHEQFLKNTGALVSEDNLDLDNRFLDVEVDGIGFAVIVDG